MISRVASHSGSWYDEDKGRLDRQLTSWLDAVDPSKIARPPLNVIDENSASTGDHLTLPIEGLKAIIAPHAGYSYSGPAAAWAYKCVDRSKFDRIFILGPSHHIYLDGCALSGCSSYETPIGDLPLDLETINELRQTGKFSKDMTILADTDEHSIEMHLPYIRKVFEHRTNVKIIPILVGSISAEKEVAFGKLLAPYLADPQTLFVISSDFCHWGSRFRYTYYQASLTQRPRSLSSKEVLTESDIPVHASIRALDGTAIARLTYPETLSTPDAKQVALGKPSTNSIDSRPRSAFDAQIAFQSYLRDTSNTICGRHPIGVLLGALSALEKESKTSKQQLNFTRYEQSSQCKTSKDSSVSYASAFVRFY